MIDECLYAMRNKWAPKCYNPSKPAKYGINVKCLNDCQWTYTYRSELFCGKPEIIDEVNGYYCSTTYGLTVRLLEKYGWRHLKGCNLTTDNLYSSLPLLETLEEKQMTFLGTMRSNRLGVANEMKSTDAREDKSAVVWFEKENGRTTLTSYVRKTKSKGWKAILLLSNLVGFPTMGITKDDGHFKTALNKLYDFLKCGTDISGKNFRLIISISICFHCRSER